MSVLSGQSDGMGYYYGFLPDDYRRIDVRRQVSDDKPAVLWHAFVAGILVGVAGSKDEAETLAVDYMKTHPEPCRDEEE